jgi:EcsC protein family/Resolvase, N terminal domain
MIVGYARVSTDGQSLESQHSALRQAGATQVYAEKVSLGDGSGDQYILRATRSQFADARFIVDRGVLAEGGPVLVRLLAQIASRFGVVVTQKLAAQAVPLIGALGGAAVNYAFIDHFQEIARGHFTVRRLERRYGKEAVRTAYDKLSSAMPAAA